MGRITIFIEDDCIDCLRLLSEFEKRGLFKSDAVEACGERCGVSIINISAFPLRRNDMLSLSDEYKPPQVHMNETYIGGLSNALHMLKQWDGDPDFTTYELYERMVVNAPDPQDARLQLPNPREQVEEQPPDEVVVDVPPPSLEDESGGQPAPRRFIHRTSRFIVDDWISTLILEPSSYDEEVAIVRLPAPLPDKSAVTVAASRRNSSGAKGGIKSSGDGSDDIQMVSVRQMTKLLQSILKRKDLGYNMTTYKKSFKASHCIDVLSKHFNISREQASGFARSLQYDYLILDHVVSDHCIEDTDTLYFRLTCDQTPHILNTFRKWIDVNTHVDALQQSHQGTIYCDSQTVTSDLTWNVREDDSLGNRAVKKEGTVSTATKSSGPPQVARLCPVVVAHPEDAPDNITNKLHKMMMRILDDNTTSSPENGSLVVDYKKCVLHPLYPIFEDLICQLQEFDISRMVSNEMKMAFCINLYNIMIRYAFIKVGIVNKSSDVQKRQQFFSQIMVRVGDDVLSFDDIEHGILRNNRKAPSLLVSGSQFNTKDSRRASLILPKIDHRIHFALNCGSKSCPMLRLYHGHAIHEELRVSGQEYCNDDRHVFVDQVANELHLSQMFHWYKDDFVNPVSHSLHGGSNHSPASSVVSSPAKTHIELPQIVLLYLKGKKKAILTRMINGVRDGERPPIKILSIPYDWGNSAKDFIPFNANCLRADVSRLSGK